MKVFIISVISFSIKVLYIKPKVTDYLIIFFSLFIGLFFRIQIIFIPISFILIAFIQNRKLNKIKVTFTCIILLSVLFYYYFTKITISDFRK